METAAVFRLVVGLGNPGQKYAGTRHNVGFLVVEELARRSATSFAFDARWDADLSLCGGRALMKPETFMNLSGEAVVGYAHYFKLNHDDVLVILDDASLPLGQLRLRKSGSAGGHNGLESVLVHFGTELVPRLRVGIGAPDGRALHDHVLGRFSDEERDAVADAVARAADAFEFANAHGLEAAMNQFNQKNQEP